MFFYSLCECMRLVCYFFNSPYVLREPPPHSTRTQLIFIVSYGYGLATFLSCNRTPILAKQFNLIRLLSSSFYGHAGLAGWCATMPLPCWQVSSFAVQLNSTEGVTVLPLSLTTPNHRWLSPSIRSCPTEHWDPLKVENNFLST